MLKYFCLLLLSSINLSFAYGASWASLEGVYLAEGQSGCAEKLEISYQDSFGFPQIFGYDRTYEESKRIFAFGEGEWVSGFEESTRHHFSYEINNGAQGHYYTYLVSDVNHEMLQKINIQVKVEDDISVDVFHYYDDKYDSKESAFCIYVREGI